MCRPRRSKGGIADGLLPNHVTFDRCAPLALNGIQNVPGWSAVTLLHRYGILARRGAAHAPTSIAAGQETSRTGRGQARSPAFHGWAKLKEEGVGGEHKTVRSRPTLLYRDVYADSVHYSISRVDERWNLFERRRKRRGPCTTEGRCFSLWGRHATGC